MTVLLLSSYPSGTRIAQELDGIFALPEFRRVDWAGRLWQWFMELLSRLGIGAQGQSLFTWIIIVLAAGGAVVGLFFLLRHIIRRRSGGLREERPLSHEETYAEMMQLSLHYAGQGEYTLALICLFLAHLHDLAGQGLIRLDESKTNRQYMGELQKNGYGKTSDFAGFAREYNLARYGGRPVTAEGYGRWRAVLGEGGAGA